MSGCLQFLKPYCEFDRFNPLILCKNRLYKCFHFINFVTLVCIIRGSSMMTIYTHRNMQQCYKKQVLLLYIVHLLDKCSNILQNARYIHQGDQCTLFYSLCIKVNIKWSRYRPGVAQRVGRGIALLFHDRGTRSGWVVSGTPRPHFTPARDPVPILQEAGWVPGPVWTGGKSRPHRDSIPDRSQSLFLLSYPAHFIHFIQ